MLLTKIKTILLQLIKITFGTIIMAISTSLLLLPNQLSSGGFSGIATIFYYLFKIPLGTIILLLNIPLFLITFIKKGKYFFCNALIGTALLSFFINYFDRFNPLTKDRFLACIYGGIISGIGSAIILKTKSSTRRNRSFNSNY